MPRGIGRWAGLLLGGLLAAVAVGGGDEARADGRNLDGQLAPDMVFDGGVGLGDASRLSDLRGRVVWVKFVLADCARCRLELPRMQARHEQWAGSGLVTLAVMHALDADAIRTWQRRERVDLPVARDEAGRLARLYGVVHRPTDYVIDVDGRVRQSNGASGEVLRAELARYRLRRVGEVPPALATAKAAAGRWNLGEALRLAEGAQAGEGGEEGFREGVARIRSLARDELRGRLDHARRLVERDRRPEARTYLDRLVAHFQGTSLSGEAERAREAILAPTAPPARDAR